MALVSAALGRPAAVVGTTVPISLVAPGEVWGDRVNALDLRFAKILRFGRARYNVGIDIINVTNSDAILTYNQNFNPAATTGAALAGADVGADAALREDRRADRLLTDGRQLPIAQPANFQDRDSASWKLGVGCQPFRTHRYQSPARRDGT